MTEQPTPAWTSQQFREAFPWDRTPRYIARDRDHAYVCTVHRMRGIALECDTASAGLNAAGSCVDVTPMRRGRAVTNVSCELVIVRGIAGVARSSASGRGVHFTGDGKSVPNASLNPARLIPPPESFYPAFGVHRLANAGESGMAMRADFYVDVRPCGAGGNFIAAGATDSRVGVRRMNVFLHKYLSCYNYLSGRPGAGVNSGQPSPHRPRPIRRPSPTSPDRTAGTQSRRPRRPPARSDRSGERRRNPPELRRPSRWG